MRPIATICVVGVVVVGLSAPSRALAVNAGVDLNTTIATMPEYGMGIHTSVYDNSLQFEGSPVYNQLGGLLDEAGVDVLRYPGGGYADVFHFSLSRPTGMSGYGTTPWWGIEGNYGYMGPKTDFGNFVKLLDATNSKTVITVNTGGAVKFNSFNQLGVPTHPGQPQEAAAWVAYANADASIYGTPSDIPLGSDAEGNDWKTAGYWAKLRTSTSSEYASWASADGVYDSRNAFLAIDRDDPVGIEYWEIGNETFGTNYYGGPPYDPDDPDPDAFRKYTGYALNYAYPYDWSARDDRPELSPAAYGQQVNEFQAAMKAVDPTIKIGAVLATPRTDAFVSWNPIGDYIWSYADLNDDGVKQSNEPYWNDEVLERVADNVDFVIAHWYPNPDNGSSGIVHEPRLTIPVMINGTTAGLDTGTNAGLRDSIAAWRTDGDPNGLEIFITETDGYGGSNQSADGLFTADMYATFFEHGVSNVDYLELHNNQFLNESINAANFAYFGIQSVHLLAEAGDELVSTTTTENDVRIHAAVQADGSVAVMILNMNTSSRTVDVSITGATLDEDGVMYQTDGDSPLFPANLGGLGNSFSTSIPARNLQVFVIPLVASPGLSGDYNGDGIVDAGDYNVWRDTLGSTTDLRANGDNTGASAGVIDEADYAVWKANFGLTSAAGSSLAGGAAVPEPATIALFAIALLAALAPRARTMSTRQPG